MEQYPHVVKYLDSCFVIVKPLVFVYCLIWRSAKDLCAKISIMASLAPEAVSCGRSPPGGASDVCIYFPAKSVIIDATRSGKVIGQWEFSRLFWV